MKEKGKQQTIAGLPEIVSSEVNPPGQAKFQYSGEEKSGLLAPSQVITGRSY
jgi:hypothetical protein